MPELFANFEVNRESRRQTISGLLGGSVLLHLALIAIAVYVPTVRQAFNIAALLGGSDYVEKPYARTTIGENIQVLQLAPKFQYPPGYFAVGTPEALATATPNPANPANPNDPRIISQVTTPVRLNAASPSPSPTPTSSPSPVIAQAQTSPSQSSSPNPTGQSSGSDPSATATPRTAEEQKNEEAQKKLEEAAAANNVELPAENEINKQPLKDLAGQMNELKNKGKLDLDKPFEVVIEGMLNSKGRLKDPTVTQKSGDVGLTTLAKEAVAAVNDSGLLAYLKDLNEGKPTKLVVIISQDQNSMLAKFESEVESEDSAKQKASGFNAMLVLGQQLRKGKDEEILMSHTSASANGKKLVFTFKMPTQAVGEMIKKQMASNSAPKG